MRLTINTSAASDWVLSKDGEKLYYLTSFEKGNDVWVTEVRTRETKLFNKLGANTASMELSPDGKFLFVVGDGKAVKVDTESGKSEPIAVNTEMVLDYSAEKAYIFDHSWRQFKEKLVFPTSRTSIGTPITRFTEGSSPISTTITTSPRC
jgi:dipeptidyl aminopeptidase/acylaminoacyl peptidase